MEFTVADFLAMSELENIRLVAGKAGIGNVITRTNIMDNPDTFDWLIAGEFLLSTGYIFQRDEALQRQIVRSLARINCAGLCIKIGRYLKKVPKCMIEEADQLGLPLIELPFGYSLSTTIGIVNREITAQSNKILEGALSVHREVMSAALASGGLQNLCGVLSRLVGNPVIITDSDWNLLCHVDYPDNPLPLAKCINISRKQPPFPPEFINSLPNTLRYYKKVVSRQLLLGNRCSVNCLILPIAAHNFIYGYLVVWASVRPMVELDYVAMEQVAIVAALERIRAREVEQTKLRVRKDFFDDLLSGSIESVNAIRVMAEFHGLRYDDHYRCFVLGFENDDTLLWQQLPGESSFHPQVEQISEIISKLFKDMGLSAITLSRGTQLVILVRLGPASEAQAVQVRQAAQYLADAIPQYAEDHKILVVVGQEVSDLGKICQSYRSAQSGMRLVRSMQLRSLVTFMDDLAVFRLLNEHVDKTVLRNFFQSSIGPLLEYDRHHDSQLTQTLYCYFQNNSNVSDAAKDMFIHRNTCIYRIEKAKALLGTDFKNANKRLELQLAILVWQTINAVGE